MCYIEITQYVIFKRRLDMSVDCKKNSLNGISHINLKEENIDSQVIEKVPVRVAIHYGLIPYKFENGKLIVVLSDPLNTHKIDDLKLILDTDIEPALGDEKDISEAIQKYYGVGANISEEMDSQNNSQSYRSQVETIDSQSQDHSVIQFVNQIFSKALDERATDIHLEPFRNQLRIRFRIDGFLYDVPISNSMNSLYQVIVSRIKIMASLDIAEHRIPQDGRIRISIAGKELDLRVSILPSCFGESVQIRILSLKSFLGLSHLGLSKSNLSKIEHLINRSHGIIFVTGPTGSGKSTTLYAALQRKNIPQTKIITIEDPIEYQIGGVTQMQINSKIKFTFASGLRSILRHDPDIIMVGEVRDAETADITIRSAMTGHLVFSTLHANNAVSTPGRLIDMGIEPFLVASSLEGVVAQRLIRVLCPECKRKKRVLGSFFKKEGLAIDSQNVEIYEPKGCESCRFTGFRGRVGVFEVLIINDEIRELILNRVASHIIKEKVSIHTLRHDGLEKVLDGTTSLSEVMRVT
ncbi:MAG: type II/IV secretion system protein [Candidatus Omnitrophica bacterium]|nr:type II/IV secretion system protein [Candidatus Omnitrophota bacterium]